MKTRRRSSADNLSCAISSAPARSMASSRSRFQPQVGDTLGFVLRDAERSRQDLKATLDDVNDRLARTARVRPVLQLRLARRGPLQHPGPRLRLYQARARPGPHRRLLHRLRNRPPRRANLAAPVLRRPRADLSKEKLAPLRHPSDSLLPRWRRVRVEDQ